MPFVLSNSSLCGVPDAVVDCNLGFLCLGDQWNVILTASILHLQPALEAGVDINVYSFSFQ